jgi:adenosylhomocysteine nucleosidase
LTTHPQTLFCFALKEEAAPFRKRAAGMVAAAQAASVLITGMGRKNAEKSVREFLATNSPKLVLTCGFAGGLNPDLAFGTVVFETPKTFPSRSRGNETQIKIGNESETPRVVSYEKLVSAGAKPAKFFCADHIATTVAEKKKLREETGADAVEMESGAIHAICRECGIHCATVRVILDTASEDLPLDFNALAKPDMTLDYSKLMWMVVKSPGKIGALMRLRRRCRFAADQLAAVLSQIL